ncbi:MAG TPA: hypothetical protein P5210_11440 [Draconibacterium sp.]|nr:hypothetical protein [Draconibacterium sp.]
MRILIVFLSVLISTVSFSQSQVDSCKTAFNYVFDENNIENTIKICSNAKQIPFRYEADINMPVCDDTLCANVILQIYWDLAGNYAGFDTVPGFPLTKFDHKKFTSADYEKLDQILKNRNSMLRILNKEDLVDKSVKVKSETVDAVTGATPQTVKKSVVEGAVYSSYSLWHFVNGAIKNQMTQFTQNIYSESITRQLLQSANYETQLFALKKMSENDFEFHSDLLFEVIRKSVPLIKAYIIVKTPLPFSSIELNKQFAALFPTLDDYSKSMFLNRVITEKSVAEVFLPFVIENSKYFNEKQLGQIAEACRKFEIPGFEDFPEVK